MLARRDWQSGTPSAAKTGWLARYLNSLPAASLPGAFDLFNNPTMLFGGSSTAVPTFNSIGSLAFPNGNHYSGFTSDLALRQTIHANILAAMAKLKTPLATVAARETNLLSLIRSMQTLPAFTPAGSYPATDFGTRMMQIPRLISANIGMRLFHIGRWGFDLHGSQNGANRHAIALKDVSDTVSALYADLVAMGQDQNTLIMISSEFGRTVYENGDRGTDHGTVNPVFVLGGSVKGGFVNAHPPVSVAQLDPITNELQLQADFRDVYGTILMRWFGLSQFQANALFPGYSGVTDLGFLV